MDDTKLNMLTQYLAMKWALVPLHHVLTFAGRPVSCSCRQGDACKSAGKHPRLTAWQVEANLVRTVEQLHTWPDETNWGLATGRASGVWALDVDPKSGGWGGLTYLRELGLIEPTRLHQTGSGGLHFLYRMPPDFVPTNRTGALPDGIDVRGDGGQIVLPPSVSGVGEYSVNMYYATDFGTDVRNAHPGLLDLIRPAPQVHVPRVIMDRVDPGGRYASYARKAVVDELAALRETHSSRNSRAWQAAARIIELCNAPWAELDLDEEYDRWREAGHAHPDGVDVPPTELDAVWRSALRHVGGREASGPSDRPWPPAGDVELLDFPGGRGSASSSAAGSTTGGPLVDFAPISSGASAGPAGSAIPTGPVAVEGFTPVDGRWTPVDISDVLDGTAVDVLPELGRRQDGIPLLYRGKEHSVAGEPESGKTWFALLLAAQVLLAGGRVVYVDFEDDARTVVGRLLKLGVLADRLRAHAEQFRYVRPETGPVQGDVQGLLGFPDGAADLLVYDGYTEGAALAGRDIMSQNDIALWRQALVKPALDLGCATLVTDHVIKDKDTRGRYAIGAQHKLAGLTGVQFLVDVVETWGKGARGRSRVIITKDRNGGLRPHGQATGTANHTHIGDLVGDASSGDMTSLILWPPFRAEDEGWEGGLLAGPPSPRWSKVLAVLLKRLAASLEPLSQNATVRDVPGSKPDVIAALRWLVDAGYVDVDERGQNRMHVVSNVGIAKIKELSDSSGTAGTVPVP